MQLNVVATNAIAISRYYDSIYSKLCDLINTGAVDFIGIMPVAWK